MSNREYLSLNKKYDGMMYGNGLSILLLSQLKQIAPQKYGYEFSFSDFASQFVDGAVSEREKRELSKLFDSLLNSRYVRNSYEDYRHFISGIIEKDGFDFEQILGRDILLDDKEKKTRNAILHSIYPVMYNYWGDNTAGLINAIFKEDYTSSFCKSVKSILTDNAYVFTTNFDAFTNHLNPRHIHGRFVDPLTCEKDLVYKFYGNDGDYYYKFIWGHNGAGKFNLIRSMHDSYGDWGSLFDWDFFYDDRIKIDNLLVFGLGFKNAAYSSAIRPYDEHTIHKGFVIDDHILFRLNKLQEEGRLRAITFAYYSEDEKGHYKDLANIYELKTTSFISTKEFAFSI